MRGEIIFPQLAQKIKRLIILRLLIVALFLVLGVVILDVSKLVFYSLISIICFLSLVYALWLATRKQLLLLGYLQICLDLILETVLVHYTGGVDSFFVTFYVLSILSAGFILVPGSNFIVASIASVFFILLIIAEYFGWIPEFLPPVSKEFQIPQDWIYVLYMGYVRITIFCIVGFLAGYFSNIVNKMEERIKAKEKYSLLGEVSAGIAHEIRNPLTSISGLVEVLRKELDQVLNESNKYLMNAIVEETERLKNFFNRLLDYARVEDLKLEKLSLQKVLDESFILLEHNIDFNKIEIAKKYRNKDINFFADHNKIKQVFLNLILNAFQAMPQGGTLSIDVVKKNRNLQISFKDTGRGMDSKALKSLFIPFESSKRGGTGIGLAIAQKIIHQHGGNIKVKTRLGRGTDFIVSLPKIAG